MSVLFFLALSSFIFTNIDDFFILIYLFSISKKKERKYIYIWQILWFVSLLLISYACSVFTSHYFEKYVYLLWIFPIIIWLYWLYKLYYSKEDDADDEENISSINILNIATLTIVNGTDNVSIYTPLFATSKNILIFFVLFILFLVVLLFITSKLSKQISKKYHKIWHISFLFFIILLWVYILSNSKFL